jgi:cullin 3
MFSLLCFLYQEHQITMVMIRDILMYMDRTYVMQQRRRPVFDMGLHLFRLTVWEHPSIRPRIIDLILDAIAHERAGLLTDDRTRLRVVLSMLLELGRADTSSAAPMSHVFSQASPNVYQIDFEQVFLGTTQEFYHTESLEYLAKNTAVDYVRKASSRLEEEAERVVALGLPLSTEGPLTRILQTELIERHAQTLVSTDNLGFAVLLRAVNDDPTKLSAMQEMYDLFSRVPSAVDHLRDAVAVQIKSDGHALTSDQISGTADPPAFVRGVLAMRQKYEIVVEITFRNEKKTQKRMRESIEDFLNADARAASCLAVYVDELLRGGLKGATTEQMNSALNDSIIVFRYLSDKDVFESFYKQHLAKRLLGGRSISDDAERSMVSLLKAECGYQFTTKLEGMFNDMRISRETRESYKAYKRSPTRKNDESALTFADQSKLIDVEVDVLTAGYWPSQNVPVCILPRSVQSAIDHFSTFYLKAHTGRKLSWQTSAGAAELKAVFGTGPDRYRRHELCVSTYQMCILLLFNDHDVLTLGQIRAQTHIPDQELRRHLISLCTPKNRILKKGSKGRGITTDHDTFTFNADYTSKLKRVRISLVKDSSISRSPGDEAGGGSAPGPTSANGEDGAPIPGGVSSTAGKTMIDGSIPVSVEEDRRHLVEAAIVRIMKARKSLHHNELIAEVTRQLTVRFCPSPQFIKKRIESLIDREYLERHETEHRLYKYVA